MTAPPANSLEIDVVRSAMRKHYEILEELGRGGMAVVYRARELALDREVAIKVLPAAMTFDAEFVERFQREARTAGQLEHPNIVPIYRVGRAGRVIYFVMKLLRGKSLAAVIRERGRLSVDEVRHIILDTATALGYAAKRGVVHRDVKPDNILLDSDGRCVVTDFGIAKTASGPRTAAGTSMGTPRYMSPEHAQGVPVDGRSDIYSLGVVAYQCLAGSTPFEGDDPFAVLYKHINSPVPRPELSTEDEETLYGVIERMLAKTPEGRFQDANELIVALGGVISQPTLVASHPPTRVSRLTPTEIIITPFSMRMRQLIPKDWRVGAGAAFAAVGLVFLGTFFARTIFAPSGSDSTVGAAPLSLAVPPVEQFTKLPPALVVAVPPPPPPEPFSKCTRRSGAAATRTLYLLIDPIRTQSPTATLPVRYDVCGLPSGTPYETFVTLRKTSRGRLSRLFGGGAGSQTWTKLDVADSPRTRRSHSINLKELGVDDGTYEVEIGVRDDKKREEQVKAPFEIKTQ